MRTQVMYSQKIRQHSGIFKDTVRAYRDAVSFFISVCLKEWEVISGETVPKQRMTLLEKMTHPTEKRPEVPHCFDSYDPRFYKFPSYLWRP